MTRQNLALTLCETRNKDEGAKDSSPLPVLLARHHGKKDSELVDFFLELFLQGAVPPETRKHLTDYLASTWKQTYPVYWSKEDIADHRILSICHLVLTLPEFQLD